MNKIIQIVLFLVKPTVFALLCGIAVHVVIMTLDFFLMSNGLYLDLRNNFLSSISSRSMVPMISVYGLLSFTAFLLWHRTKEVLLIAHRRDIEREEMEKALRALQRFTGMVSDRISTQNAEILSQAESRRKQGRPMSKKVEIASRNIALALTSLSETAFVSPYTEKALEGIQDLESKLQKRLYVTIQPIEKIGNVQ